MLGTPINVTSDSFEAKMALSSITQNAGYSGLREISANTNPGNNEALVKIDDTRTRRSRDNMVEVKKKKVEKLRKQKQFTSKGANLSTYRGSKGDDSQNIAPSKSFLCSDTQNLSINK